MGNNQANICLAMNVEVQNRLRGMLLPDVSLKRLATPEQAHENRSTESDNGDEPDNKKLTS